MRCLEKSDKILTTCKHRELILFCKYSGKIHMIALALKLMFYVASKLAVDQHVWQVEDLRLAVHNFCVY